MTEDTLARRVRSVFEDGYEPPSGGFEARMRNSLQRSPERVVRPGWAFELAAVGIAVMVISVLTLGRFASGTHSPSGGGLVTHSPAPTTNVASTPCGSVTASATPATATGPGITVAITASAAGCPNPLYKFWVLYPGLSTWKLAQSYSANTATFNWDTSSKPPGAYHLSIWARDAGSPGTSSNSLGSWDAYTTLQYTLPVWPYTPCYGYPAPYITPGSPQQVGTVVSITGKSFSCPNPRYEFWIQPPKSNMWQLGQAYSANATFNWHTSGERAPVVVRGIGDYYLLQVWARDASSAGVFSDALGSNDFFITSYYALTSSPCASVSASAAPTAPQAAGTAVTITGFAFSCPNPTYEFWILPPGSTTWQVARSYTATATFGWDTTGKAAGVYHFSVWARDTSSVGTGGDSLGTWDATTAITYTLT